MASIPEDETLNEQLSVLRPLNEVKMDQINYHQMLKKYDLKPKKDVKALDKKSKNLKVV